MPAERRRPGIAAWRADPSDPHNRNLHHHFVSKLALFEAVLELQEARVTAEVLAAAQSPDPWEAGMRALGAYLDHRCDPA